MKRIYGLTIIALITSLLTGCGVNVSPNTYDACEAGVASRVDHGVVVGKRRVNIDARRGDGVGALAGATAGAVGGSAIGGGDRAHILGAVGGAVLGGVIGNAIEKKATHHVAYEYIIRLRSGGTISVAQSQELEFQIHQPVMIIYGPTTRIVPDDSVPCPAPRRGR